MEAVDARSFTCKASAVATDLAAKALEMREAGALSAKWDKGDRVKFLTLNPITPPSQPTQTQKKPLTEEAVRAEHRRVALASGSRLIPVGREQKT